LRGSVKLTQIRIMSELWGGASSGYHNGGQINAPKMSQKLVRNGTLSCTLKMTDGILKRFGFGTILDRFLSGSGQINVTP
jgi:hypothetical protein